jgi:hypothetical protein
MSAIPRDALISEQPEAKVAVRYSEPLLYALWALFSVIMILVAVSDYYRGGGRSFWKPLLWEGSALTFATLMFTLQRTVARRRYNRWLGEPAKWFAHHLKWFPLSLVAFLILVYGAREGVYALVGQRYHHDPWSFLVPYEAIRLLLFFGLWLGVIFGFDSFERWHRQQDHLLKLQRALAESRLTALSSQLRPHFFFNALNTISALMHLDVERADRLLSRVGELLRYSLESDGHELVTLAEELRLLDLYAQIMLERFADRVTLEWRVDRKTLDTPVPRLLMQPLLENAFKHAVERGLQQVRIEIGALRNNEDLVLTVHNTGSSLPTHWREGVGFRNGRQRLQVIYGAAARTSLKETATGVEAVITLPCAAYPT